MLRDRRFLWAMAASVILHASLFVWVSLAPSQPKYRFFGSGTAVSLVGADEIPGGSARGKSGDRPEEMEAPVPRKGPDEGARKIAAPREKARARQGEEEKGRQEEETSQRKSGASRRRKIKKIKRSFGRRKSATAFARRASSGYAIAGSAPGVGAIVSRKTKKTSRFKTKKRPRDDWKSDDRLAKADRAPRTPGAFGRDTQAKGEATARAAAAARAAQAASRERIRRDIMGFWRSAFGVSGRCRQASPI